MKRFELGELGLEQCIFRRGIGQGAACFFSKARIEDCQRCPLLLRPGYAPLARASTDAGHDSDDCDGEGQRSASEKA